MPNSTPRPASTNRERTEEKEHYESLISLFKYSVTIVTILIGIIGVVIGFFTYSNGQEMREAFLQQKTDFKEKIQEMKSGLDEQKAELDKRESEMKSTLAYLMSESKIAINDTRTQAISQIGGIKDVATNEAVKRIDQVFQQRNFDGFVEEVAQKRMEPQIEGLVDKRLALVEKNRNDRIDKAIMDLTSRRMFDVNKAVEFLKLNPDLNESQIKKLIGAYKNATERYSVHMLLYNINSPLVEDFYRSQLLLDPNFEDPSAASADAINYLTRTRQDMELYYKALKSSKDKNMFGYLILVAVDNNQEVALELLNSKLLVDYVLSEAPKPNLDNIKRLIDEKIKDKLDTVDYKQTYYYKRFHPEK